MPKPVERSTYVLAASLALALLYWQWRPIPDVVWSVEGSLGKGILLVLFGVGWLVVLLSTFMINHFDLFGLRQVWLRARGAQYAEVPFVTRGFYRFIRHPIMLGFLILGHAQHERDLAAAHGRAFEQYRREVPMMVPRVGRERVPAQPAARIRIP